MLGAGVGIVITSILFGVLHMELVQGSFAVAFGLFLGYLQTLKTHSIIPAMICHAANNTVSTVSEYVFWRRRGRGSNRERSCRERRN